MSRSMPSRIKRPKERKPSFSSPNPNFLHHHFIFSRISFSLTLTLSLSRSSFVFPPLTLFFTRTHACTRVRTYDSGRPRTPRETLQTRIAKDQQSIDLEHAEYSLAGVAVATALLTSLSRARSKKPGCIRTYSRALHAHADCTEKKKTNFLKKRLIRML